MSILTYQQLREMSGYNKKHHSPADVVAWLERSGIAYIPGLHGRPCSLTEYFLASKGYYQEMPKKQNKEEDVIQWD